MRVADVRPIAIVTGGARGIGLGISRALATSGWDLAVVGVRPSADVDGVADELKSHGGRVHYVQADIGDPRQRARVVADVTGTLGTPSALVNNAGRAARVRADLLDATEESFEELVRTNLQGPYFLTQAVANAMIAAGSAARGIVFVTSVSAEMVSPNRGDYCVSKAGLAMAARLFAARLAEHGIPVYEVRPGIIATDMTAASATSTTPNRRRAVPKLGPTDDVRESPRCCGHAPYDGTIGTSTAGPKYRVWAGGWEPCWHHTTRLPRAARHGRAQDELVRQVAAEAGVDDRAHTRAAKLRRIESHVRTRCCGSARHVLVGDGLDEILHDRM